MHASASEPDEEAARALLSFLHLIYTPHTEQGLASRSDAPSQIEIRCTHNTIMPVSPLSSRVLHSALHRDAVNITQHGMRMQDADSPRQSMRPNLVSVETRCANRESARSRPRLVAFPSNGTSCRRPSVEPQPCQPAPLMVMQPKNCLVLQAAAGAAS